MALGWLIFAQDGFERCGPVSFGCHGAASIVIGIVVVATAVVVLVSVVVIVIVVSATIAMVVVVPALSVKAG